MGLCDDDIDLREMILELKEIFSDRLDKKTFVLIGQSQVKFIRLFRVEV
jgi:hypothetical protein